MPSLKVNHEQEEKMKREKMIALFEEKLDEILAVNVDTMDDPLLPENYTCDLFERQHSILIPADGGCCFEYMMTEADTRDDRIRYENVLEVTVPLQHQEMLFRIVCNVVNCVVQYATQNKDARCKIADCTDKDAAIRRVFFIMSRVKCTINYCELGIYIPDVIMLHALFIQSFGIY